MPFLLLFDMVNQVLFFTIIIVALIKDHQERTEGNTKRRKICFRRKLEQNHSVRGLNVASYISRFFRLSCVCVLIIGMGFVTEVSTFDCQKKSRRTSTISRCCNVQQL